MELFKVAAKNINRNRRRSILNIAALAIGLAIMVLALGWLNGYDIYIYEALQDFETGHAQVLNEAYLPERSRLPVDITVPQYTETRDRLAEADGVLGAAGRINFSLSLSHGAKSARLLGRAIDPEHEAAITIVEDSIEEGAYLDEAPGILISSTLAEKFDVGVGDTMFATALDKYNVDNLLDARVVGIFSYGYPVIDDNVVFFDLGTASELLSFEDEVTKIVLRFDDGRAVEAGIGEIEATLDALAATQPDGAGEAPKETVAPVDLAIKSWKFFAQVAVNAVRQDTVSFQILLGIIIFLIVIGILNSMSMTVHERIREIGTIRALGMKRRQVVRLITMESATLGLLAFGAALLIAAPFALYLARVGFNIAQYIPANVPVPFGETFYAEFRLSQFLLTFAVGMATAIVGALIPARRAAKLEIAEAMRTVR